MNNQFAILDHSVRTGIEPPIYVCKRCDDYGLTQDNQIVVGLTLVLENEDQHDFLKEEAQNAGTDSIIHFPPEGLIEGRRYTAFPINFVRNWESGIVEDWEVKISLVEELVEEAALAAMTRERDRLRDALTTIKDLPDLSGFGASHETIFQMRCIARDALKENNE